jgi:hypothetical protein
VPKGSITRLEATEREYEYALRFECLGKMQSPSLAHN